MSHISHPPLHTFLIPLLYYYHYHYYYYKHKTIICLKFIALLVIIKMLSKFSIITRLLSVHLYVNIIIQIIRETWCIAKMLLELFTKIPSHVVVSSHGMYLWRFNDDDIRCSITGWPPLVCVDREFNESFDRHKYIISLLYYQFRAKVS